MATTNVDQPFGLRLVGSIDGRQPQTIKCFIPATDEVAVFMGDTVKIAGGADGEGLATVAQSAATNAIFGVITKVDQDEGVTSANRNVYRKHRPADLAMYVDVCIDPNALFEIQADDVSATLAAADIGLNASIIVGSGSTTTGLSGIELDTDTKNTTATLELKILGLIQRPDNAKFAANQKVLVKINNHQLGSHTGTVGIS